MTKRLALLWIAPLVIGVALQAHAQAAAASTRAMGTVKAIAGNTITLTTDAGADVSVAVADGARVVRTAPGQKDLTGAMPVGLQEVQPGDRMLVKGKASEDGKSLTATLVVVMKKTDIAEKQSRESEDWQKRGIGGPVTAIDLATGTITVSTSGAAGKSVAVHTTKATIVRRYSPDSVKFEEAKLATLAEIKPGDQLRARGNRSEDGSELAAEEIVAGTFHNIAGTIVSTDAANNSFTVTDLETKKPVVVKVTADSQLRKLPPMVAQGIAMRLKGGAGQNGGSGHRPEAGNGAGPGANGNGRGGDFNQMLSHLPVVTIGELHKGDAVMIVTTQGTGSQVTAITLLSGVEPILTASPKGNGSMILSPWNLGGGEGGDSAQ